MSSALGNNVWVFHAGALGDHVMTWPLVRAMARQGTRVTVVAAGEHARLCEAEVGRSLGSGVTGLVVGVDAEQGRFTRLWRGAEGVRAEDVVAGVETIVTFMAPNRDGGESWHDGAAAMFPGAERVCIGRPDQARGADERTRVWALAGVEVHGGVEPRCNKAGPVVLYLGAGSPDKRVPSEVWARVAGSPLIERAAPIELVVGRNEAETGAGVGDIMLKINGHSRVRARVCADVSALADCIGRSRVFIGADTGPTHLAAQLGVPTIAIFGTTDPGVWGPQGPCVRILQGRFRRTWPDSDEVVTAIRDLLPA